MITRKDHAVADIIIDFMKREKTLRKKQEKETTFLRN